MSAPARRRFTFAEYLELEEVSNVKHEYAGGDIYAMAGGTPEHAALSVSASSHLFAALRGSDCRVYSSDLRIRVMATGLASYPDVTVVYGPLEHDPESRTTVTNPRLVVEVLSPSTEDYDRGEKLAAYQQVESLGAVLFVRADRREVELASRGETGWSTQRSAGAALHLAALGVDLDVDGLYGDAGL